MKPEGTGEAEPVLFKEGPGSYALYVGLDAKGQPEGYVVDEDEFVHQTISSEPLEANVWPIWP